MRKSQISLEFMFAIGITFFIFLILLGFMFNRNIELKETEDYLEKENECWKVSNLISSVFTAGDGTVVNISTENVVHIYGDGTMTVEKKLGEGSMKLAYYCCQPDQEYEFLGEELNANFEVTQYIADDCNPGKCHPEICEPEYCDPGTCEPIVNQFLLDIDQYGMVFLEDPHLKDVEMGYIGKLDSFVKNNGGIVVISEHIKQGNLFGLNLDGGIKDRDNDDEYATVVDDYKYNLGIGEDIWFEQKPAIKVADVTISDFKVIANYSKKVDNSELAAIAVWGYGSGEVSYFADFEEKTPEIGLPAVVVEYVRETVNLLSDPSDSAYCTYIGNIASEGKFSGDILIQNIDNVVVLENV